LLLHPNGRGPNIPDRTKEQDEYSKYLISAVHSTLKSDLVDGKFYSDDQKELMIWYKYLFLGRGKPVTHIQVLPEIPIEEVNNDLPEVFTKLFSNINHILNLE
jgi:putative ATP-dependent endonuclease of the OLD family